MSKIFVILLLLYYSVKSETIDDEFEEIEEFIPKTFFSDGSDKFFKYYLSCKDEKNKTYIYFQALPSNTYSYYFYII